MNNREIFLRHVGQTSPSPMLVEIEKAENIYLYSPDGKRYIDLCSGVSVSNLGHGHPRVVEAVKKQVDKYMHLMVYGEIVESPQVQFAKLLTDNLPGTLDSVYFVNSGSEAIEGAMKLAKRYTGRSEIISFWNAYHGSTHGALSILGDLDFIRAFRPLLPDIRRINFMNFDDLEQITEQTAAVVVEPIQAEAGVIVPSKEYLQALRKRCDETGCMLIFDEVQLGFGRTGKLFAFEHFDVVPDILVIAKAAGGGMPLGAFVAGKKVMDTLTYNPALGHITTFGGHPVSCAAALESLRVLLEENIIADVERKGQLFIDLLKDNPKIKSIGGKGLILAVELEDEENLSRFMQKAVENGLITDVFLFARNKFRIGPPLIIRDEQIEEIVQIIEKTLDRI